MKIINCGIMINRLRTYDQHANNLGVAALHARQPYPRLAILEFKAFLRYSRVSGSPEITTIPAIIITL
eukprot:4642370-Amphidinium_carterae.1